MKMTTSSVKKFCSENKIDLNFNLLADKSLQRGDLKIKSGSIEVSEIIDDKIKLSQSSNIKKELNNLEDKISIPNKVKDDKSLKINPEETSKLKKKKKMLIADQMLSTIENISFSNINHLKVELQNLMGKLLNVTLFPSPIGTLCKLYCNNGTFVTGEIIGFREKKILLLFMIKMQI